MKIVVDVVNQPCRMGVKKGETTPDTKKGKTMKTLMVSDLDVQVKMNEIENGYEVVYGLHGVKFANFKQAFDEFNSCVKHSAVCASLLDDDDEYLQD